MNDHNAGHLKGGSVGVDDFFACVRDWLTLPAASMPTPRTSVCCPPAKRVQLPCCSTASTYSTAQLRLDRLGPEWEKAVRDLHTSGWRR